MPTVDFKAGGEDVTIFYDVYGVQPKQAEAGENITEAPDASGEVSSCAPEDLSTRSASQDPFNASDPSLTITAMEQNPPALSKNGTVSSPALTSSSGQRASARNLEPPCRSVLIIAGLGARGRTEFFQHIVAHFASLKDSLGKDLLSVCTYDTRGIGGSTVPQKLGQYSTRLMAEDALALMDYLEWEQAHILGLSLGGMIACKLAAMSPSRVASLSLISTTSSGWHMLAGISREPWPAYLAGSGPLKWKIPANLRYNFSERYLREVVDGKKTRMEVLIENTHKAIEEKDSGKFLAEGQADIGRKGHLAAVFKHRMHRWELETIRGASFPTQVIVGRHDRVARAAYVSHLAKKLRASYLEVEAGHAGILIEAPESILPVLETLILGNAQTDKTHISRMRSQTNQQVLQDRLFAKEFLSSFGPGRVSFNRAGTSKSNARAYARSKSAAT